MNCIPWFSGVSSILSETQSNSANNLIKHQATELFTKNSGKLKDMTFVARN